MAMPDYLNTISEQVCTAQSHDAAHALCKDILNGDYEQCVKNQFATVLGMLARGEQA
jgi:hypothetical protein